MSFFKNEKNWVAFILLGLAACFIWVVFHTVSSFGGGDHYEHYKLAHYGWTYPRLLFSHWGKPVFTILMSPFAQFGLNGARIYNIFAGLLTAFLTWKLARHFNFKYAWISVIFVVFTPIYFATMFTALTEITFSLFLVLSIYLFFKDRFILSAIVLSFLPLVRTEGIILIPLFLVAYILKKQYKALPFLTVGFLLISALGAPFYESFWWLITEMPYTGDAKDIYGSGTLLHFVNHTPNITGAPIAFLFIAGLIALFINWRKNRESIINEWFYLILLIPASFLIFFAAHSFVWWQGMGNSLGLTRVIASVSPLAALTAAYGLQYFLNLISSYRNIIAFVVIAGFIFWIVPDGINKHKYGFYPSSAEELLDKTAFFLKENKLDQNKIYYFNNYIIFPLQIDPYNEKQCQGYFENKTHPTWEMPDSSIIVWDAHFGPNEGRIPLELLQNSDDLKQIAVFRPETPFTALGGHNYEIYIFQKDISLNKDFIRHINLDFEEETGASTEQVFEGNKSRFINQKEQYFGFAELTYSTISSKLYPLEVSVTFSIFNQDLINDSELYLVCSLEQYPKMLSYQTIDLNSKISGQNEWKTITQQFILPEPISSDNLIKVYIWNKAQNSFFIDHVAINFDPIK